ncbi:hypothetical protein [Nannocystis punicea]|uniref:Tryptophan synthase alpha chain n=1 Tax=Nannocystis punicea TaxID=2995304 RepID=A0ABY7H8P8_9BACT|nr:hypothetical protein [Nannocystis poenicansa]WAS95639.1 hypothetical protein O0S08_05705 [Nannocystis poenicansa]
MHAPSIRSTGPRLLPSLALLAAALSLACKQPAGSTTGTDATGEPDGSTSRTSSTAPTGTATTGEPPGSTSTTAPGATSTAGAPTTDDLPSSTGATAGDATGNFVAMPDLPPPTACDAWNDTCPPGQKCQPGALPRGPGCVDIVQNPDQIGDPCDAGEPIDSCDKGAICLGQIGDGQCLALCEGTPDAATCADACSPCFVDALDTYGTCKALCDPRAPACLGGASCRTLTHAPYFFCIPNDASVPPGMPCMSEPACQQGSACIHKDFLPSCAGDFCCAPVCDQAGPDTCDAALPGTVCNPWPQWNPEFNEACLLDGLGLCGAPQ